MPSTRAETFLLVDGENIDATLGVGSSAAGRRRRSARAGIACATTRARSGTSRCAAAVLPQRLGPGADAVRAGARRARLPAGAAERARPTSRSSTSRSSARSTRWPSAGTATSLLASPRRRLRAAGRRPARGPTATAASALLRLPRAGEPPRCATWPTGLEFYDLEDDAGAFTVAAAADQGDPDRAVRPLVAAGVVVGPGFGAAGRIGVQRERWLVVRGGVGFGSERGEGAGVVWSVRGRAR